MAVWEFPPRALRRINVSLESRYGTKFLSFSFLLQFSARISITRPKVVSD